MLDQLEIAPTGSACCALIWLHGLGADGHDFEPLVRAWGLADELGARIVLPHAPRRPVTLNNGMLMRAWYDIHGLEWGGTEDGPGIEMARQHLLNLIERERTRGIAADRIVLAGFSQGGAVALHTALRFGQPLAGVLALSSYLPLGEALARERRAGPDTLIIRMDHGDHDPVVPLWLAERSRDLIEAQGYRVEFHRYSMAHSLCPEQLPSLRAWLVQRLSRG
ncbi:MAG: alpha/beta fold hydrolase [Gammaproteobacteria bacterium]|jgi:phospholipase/carboxylesterase